MTINTPFFLFCAFAILILIPLSVIRDIKNNKKPIDIFTSNIVLFVILLVSLGEVLRSMLSTNAMNYFNQTLFLLIIIVGVIPAILFVIYSIKSDFKKWSDPDEYKYYWLYKIRYILLMFLTIIFIVALYRFYLIYKIVFT
ncbi:hypothetical protein [Bacillus solimangrovi]|uniref:Uncharacterized protein n=1 Tax=Bacillus solimangrovi TaxID=1305675 RepID=A0A1E5LG32_9BACI|nr:hypothetical protein [Bacillus solimangrovi]OEH93033.1 hypothetical protein BFG57_13840 [Bacillus solimangrovi]